MNAAHVLKQRIAKFFCFRPLTDILTGKSNAPPGGPHFGSNSPVGVLPYKRLLGMCRWMGSRFHGWIDYNGVTFLVELLEWDRTFSGFLE